MNIVAIGGGDVVTGQTASIDRTLIGLAKKLRPRALFIPTASGDDMSYVEGFSAAYQSLGCETDSLCLTRGDDPRKIERADVIYVGGGNTKMMLEKWRDTGVDTLLKKHLAEGKPAGGLSAGSICWFKVGNSDWPQYEGVPGVNTDRLDAMGLVDLALCPHTIGESFRLAEFREMMKTEKAANVGIGLDNCCAIQIQNDDYRILTSAPEAVAHRIEWVNGVLLEKEIRAHEDFKPLGFLKATENWQ